MPFYRTGVSKDTFLNGDFTTSNLVATFNVAPVITVPGAQSATEDTNKVFSSGGSNLVSIADDSLSITVTIAVTNGTLSLSGTTGLSFSVGDGTADATMTFSGSVANVNTALDGLTYIPTGNYNGASSLTIDVSDGTLTDSDSVAITVNAANDTPINTVPGAQTTDNDTPKVIAGISTSDVDGGTPNITVAVTNGTVTLSGTSGLTFSVGDGTADATMTFSGTIANINTALNNLTYTPTSGYVGAAVLTLTNNDGTASDVDTIDITVNRNLGAAVYGTIALNLDARLGVTESGGAVSMWTDQSSNAHTFSEATAAEKPTYQATGFNSLPTLSFSTGDQLICDQASSNFRYLHDMTTDYTIFIVCQQTSDATNLQRLMATGVTSNTGIDIGVGEVGADDQLVRFQWNKSAANLASALSAANVYTRATPMIVTCRLDDSGGAGADDIWADINNVQVASGDRGTTAPTTTDPQHTLTIGTSSDGATAAVHLTGLISQIIVYTGTMTSTVRTNIYNNLRNYWGF